MSVVCCAISAHAAAPSYAQVQRCAGIAEFFSSAAIYRDMGMSPKQTLGMLRDLQSPAPPLAFLKQTINTVYFDDTAKQLGPNQLYRSVYRECLFPPPDWKPLK